MLFPADGDTPDILMRNADTAMYAVKAAGRNTYQLFAQTMHAQQNAERLDLEREMRNGVQARSLWPVPAQGQRIDGELLCCEALVRWRRPALRVLSPPVFATGGRNRLIVAIVWPIQYRAAVCHDACAGGNQAIRHAGGGECVQPPVQP